MGTTWKRWVHPSLSSTPTRAPHAAHATGRNASPLPSRVSRPPWSNHTDPLCTVQFTGFLARYWFSNFSCLRPPATRVAASALRPLAPPHAGGRRRARTAGTQYTRR